MKILILGAGAVGLSIAAKLEAVCDVTAVCRKKTADAIQRQGFSLNGIWGNGIYRFRAVEHAPVGETFDYIIITAKSRDTEPICREYAGLIRNTDTVSLQNGIGNEEIISRFTDRVIGGMIITGFEWQGDAEVHVSVEAGPMKLGRFPQGTDTAVERLVTLIRSAGIAVEGSAIIQSDLWSKTLYNCALNPLGAVMGVPYGALTDPAAWRIISHIIEEGFEVIHAENVTLPWKTAKDYLAYLRDVQVPATALHHSSMLQDITKGRRTEIDFINGAIVRKGKEHGIPTPWNACIVDLIRFRESLAERGGSA